MSRVSVKHNIVANYIGQGWTAVMGLAFVPLYIKYIGVEAYGLIGVFSILQSWLSLLDLGMSPTLNREMARYSADAHSPQSIRDLLRSLETLCFGVAALIGIGVWAVSGWLASNWLKADKLSTHVVAQALSIMALVIALRFVEGIYRGSLYGLQQQVWYNGANAILATLRHGGAVLLLAWVSPTVEAFFLWQAVVSLLTIVIMASRVHRALPPAPLPARFSRKAIANVWRFAGGMIGITLLGLLISQVDKVLLSRLLSLESFGYYTLAGTVATVIYTIVSPVMGAIYPHMIELSTRDDQFALVSIYHKGSQLVTILSAPVVMLLCFFSGGVIFLWSGNASLAEKTAPIVSVLVFGNFLNGLMNMPYRLQLAHGWTSLDIKASIMALIILIPAIFLVVPRYGALGAAWLWVALNACNVMIAVPLMHRRLLLKEKWRWYFADVLVPLSGSLVVMLIAIPFQPASSQDRGYWLVFLLISGCIALVTSTLLARQIRPRLLRAMATLFHWRYSKEGVEKV